MAMIQWSIEEQKAQRLAVKGGKSQIGEK